MASVFIWPWKIGSADTLRRSPPQRNSTDSQARSRCIQTPYP
ncbi:MAG: hypothetical protein AAGD09_04730 [Cyanobacteria bacterium P01_F01_bin.56]